MARFVALLRGINVGGKHKLPMADLRARFEDAGAKDVQTYIQSGNVVFEATARGGVAIAATVGADLEASMGFAVPMVVRTAAQWKALVDGNPFVNEAAADGKRVHAMVLSRSPTKAAREAFEPECHLEERWVLHDDVLYVDYPQGSARSKVVVPLVDRALDCTSTARNWRTVLELFARVQ